MARSILAFILLIALLSACGSDPSTPFPTVTATSSPKPTSMPTLLNTSTPTTSVTPEVEKNQIELEVVEENRPEINQYTQNILFTLNEGKDYFNELGIVTIEDFRAYLQKNNNILPPSANGNMFYLFGVYGETEMRSFAVLMEQPLDTQFNFELTTNPNEAVSSMIYPYYLPPLEEKPVEKSIAISIGAKKTDDMRKMTLQIIWRDQAFDLEGRKLSPTGDIPTQADTMFRTFLYMLTALGKETKEVHPVSGGLTHTIENMELSKIITKKGSWISSTGGKAIGLDVFTFFKNMKMENSSPKVAEQMPPQIVETAK